MLETVKKKTNKKMNVNEKDRNLDLLLSGSTIPGFLQTKCYYYILRNETHGQTDCRS